MNMDDETLIDLVYITTAPNRVKVLKAFKREEYIRPTELAREIGVHKNTASENLRKLRNRGYVYLVNPEFGSPRFYKLTEKGKKILELLD